MIDVVAAMQWMASFLISTHSLTTTTILLRLLAAPTLLESKDLNAFEKRSKFVELIKQALSLKKRVDEFGDKCLTYNLPLFLDDGEYEDDQSFKNYLRYLQEFMKYWNTETEKKRGNGGKSLIERLKEVNQSQRIKKMLICIGTYLSLCISDFILMITILGDRKGIMKNLEDFKTMVKLLSLDNDNYSIVIKSLVCVIQLTKSIVKKNKRLILYKVEKSNDDGDIELELLRMILKEILCVEVVFCYPEINVVLTDDECISYESYLDDYLWNRITSLDLKMNELIVQAFSVSSQYKKNKNKCEILEKTIDEGIRNIWDKLDLNSTS
ncbi:hypothetical protein CsatB_002033 [Cannabis sativa]